MNLTSQTDLPFFTFYQHLNVQLDDMAAKVAKQDDTVIDLVDGLAQK